MPQNCVTIVTAHRGCWVGVLGVGCYGQAYLSIGAGNPRPRLALALYVCMLSDGVVLSGTMALFCWLQVIFTVNDVMAVTVNIRTTNGIIHLMSSCFAADIQVSSVCLCVFMRMCVVAAVVMETIRGGLISPWPISIRCRYFWPKISAISISISFTAVVFVLLIYFIIDSKVVGDVSVIP